LRANGVRRADRVIVMLGNQLELWETTLAAMKLGAVIIPATPLLEAFDLRDRVERGAVKHVVVAAGHVGKFADVPGDYTRIAVGGGAVEGWLDYAEAYRAEAGFAPDGPTGGSDTLLLYFTSGTTAKPKLVEHTHVSYPVGHLSTMYWIGLRPGDVHLNISSPGWAKHTWSNVFAPWNAEATVFVYNSTRFGAEALLATMARCGVDTFCAPPTVWRMLIQADLGTARVGVRELVGAGEPLNPEVIEQVEKAWGIRIRDGFGQTETTVQIANTPGQPIKPGSMGRPVPGYRVVLVDPITGQPADEGEICLDLSERPVGLMVGYAGDPDRNAEATAGGYYHTGDVGSRDADGYITYVGRSDDVFKASDYRISPFELESVLIEHDAVAEAAVVPSPDPVRLNVPKAYITLVGGQQADADTAQAILRYARQNLAPYKRVRRLEFAELPKTISGKIRRVELRKREAEVNAQPDTRPEGEYRDDDFPGLRDSS
jgi:acetyl-CoA synthetase